MLMVVAGGVQVVEKKEGGEMECTWSMTLLILWWQDEQDFGTSSLVVLLS